MSALIAAVTVSAVALVGNVVETRKAGKAQKRAIEVQQRQADIQASRDRYSAIRQARIQRGQVEQAGVSGGVGGSSGVIGAVGGLQSSLASELGTQGQMQQLGARGSMFAQKAADAQSNAAIYGAVGGFAGSIFTDLGGFKALAGKGKT